MKRILLIGEKPSQVKKFKEVMLKNSSSVQEDTKVYSYEGIWQGALGTYEVKMIPLSGHITTIDTPEDYAWGKVDPIQIVKDEKALYFKETYKFKKILINNALNYDELYIATDPDSEGDNIGLEAFTILTRKNSKFKTNVKRIWNSSLTDQEIKRAFTATEGASLGWDTRLGLSVQGRQIADAWLGFAGTREITQAARQIVPIKVFSVGRVQLPTLKMIVDRDEEHETFVPKPLWNLNAILQAPNKAEFTAIHHKNPFTDELQIDTILQTIKNEKIATVQEIGQSRLNRKPPVPLNTTAALSLIARLFKMKAEDGLQILSDLYLEGLLSYPRTENAKFSDTFTHKDILDKLNQSLKYSTLIGKIKSSKQVRTNGLQKGVEDHDPIHPTGELPALNSTKIAKKHLDVLETLTLYYIGLFMDDLILDKIKASILIKNEEFLAEGKMIVSEGWTEAVQWQKTEEELLPTIVKGQHLPISKIEKIKTQTRPKPRLNDATILKQMERLGLGTKSSRPSILEKLVERGYIIRDRTQIISQPSGRTLISVLNPIWPDIVTNTFTKDVEAKMDEVAKGKTAYTVMLDQLKQQYIQLHLLLLQNLQIFVSSLKNIDPVLLGANLHKNSSTKKNIKNSHRTIPNLENTTAEFEDLGTCPRCKEGKIIKRVNKNNQTEFLACNKFPNCKWTQAQNTAPNISGKDGNNNKTDNKYIKGNENKVSSNFQKASNHDSNSVPKQVQKCPTCKEGNLVTRTNRFSGQEFFGCSNYPNCKYTQKKQ